MSYCRWGADSDVYVYPSGPAIICHACSLTPDSSANWPCHTRAQAVEHLAQHTAAGHKVPHCAVARLQHEIAAGDPPLGVWP